MKARLLFSKIILHENEGSRIAPFVILQFEEGGKGDWILTRIKDLKLLGFTEEIKAIKKNKYRNMRKLYSSIYWNSNEVKERISSMKNFAWQITYCQMTI